MQQCFAQTVLSLANSVGVGGHAGGRGNRNVVGVVVGVFRLCFVLIAVGEHNLLQCSSRGKTFLFTL